MVELLERGQLVAIALQYGVVGVEVIHPNLYSSSLCERYFTIDHKHFNLPVAHFYRDEGSTWSRDCSEEGRAALEAAARLARSAA